MSIRAAAASLGAVMLLAALASAAEPARAAAAGLEELRTHALELVNADREENGLPSLTLGDELNEAAQAHAEDMLARDYYAHASPEGETVMDRYLDAGGSKWRLVEENIAQCAGCEPPVSEARVESLQEGWMDSPGHRENILATGVTRFGFGLAASSDGGLYAVQTFAGPGTPRGLEPGESATSLAAEEQVALALKLINRARERDGAPPLEESAALSEAARSLLPQGGLDRSFAMEDIEGIREALPAAERTEWRSLSMIAGGCGGCGTEPTAADVRFFRQQWLENPSYEPRLLDPNFTHFGFVLRASGEGRKLALAILGERR